jgi:hypothetical protein
LLGDLLDARIFARRYRVDFKMFQCSGFEVVILPSLMDRGFQGDRYFVSTASKIARKR